VADPKLWETIQEATFGPSANDELCLSIYMYPHVHVHIQRYSNSQLAGLVADTKLWETIQEAIFGSPTATDTELCLSIFCSL